MKPIITVYSTGTVEQTKKFEGYISAAFWIGVDHAEGDVESIKVRQPVESYDNEVASLLEFASLMVQRQINFAVEFFTEPGTPSSMEVQPVEMKFSTDPVPPEVVVGGEVDFETELNRIKEEYRQGTVSKKQFESKKGALLRRWKEKLDTGLER